MPVSERTADGVELLHQPDELDLRDSPHESPDLDSRRRWFRHRLASPALILSADIAVLPVYFAVAPDWWRMLATFWVTTVASFALAKLYRPRLHVALLDQLPALVRSAVGGAVVVAMVVDRVRGTDDVTDFAGYAALGLLAHVLLRAAAYWVIRWTRRSGRARHRTVVMGSGAIAQKLVRTLDEHPEYGLAVVGYVDEGRSRRQEQTPGWRYLGASDRLPEVLQRCGADVLVVAYGQYRESRLVEIVRRHRLGFVSMFVVPRLFEVGRVPSLQDHIGAIPVLRPHVVSVSGGSRVAKRAFDIVASIVAIVALSPVLAALALAVRLEGGRGVIFRQMRVGRGGREFEVLKFRSMKPADPGESDVQWSIAQDERVGKVGRFMRKTSLDELPQLFNILRGDMTIVGPRPERPHFVAKFGADMPHYDHRHRVPVGLTGLAQVSGLRGDTSIDTRARFDNFYIENWSLWLDIKVILRTVRHIFSPTGS